MTILVTGGAGYIGSHFVRYVERKKIDCIIIDNFSTGHKDFVRGKKFFEIDLRNYEDLYSNLKNLNFSAIVHFAGLSVVSDSQIKEKDYYENNVEASKNLAKFALEKKIKKFIFSSSAAVYGATDLIPIKESHPTIPINNYGKNKLETENILKNLSMEFSLDVVCLRYFNAAGADKDGDLGEKRNPETHLIPNVIKSAMGSNELTVNGNDYKTHDGTCVRDYIHVNDLASAHLLALNFIEQKKGFHIIISSWPWPRQRLSQYGPWSWRFRNSDTHHWTSQSWHRLRLLPISTRCGTYPGKPFGLERSSSHPCSGNPCACS